MFEKNQSTRGFGTGEMRLVFQQALQKSPDQASAKTPPDVKKQLEALEAEVSMQAVDLAASKDYDKVVQLKTHEWGVDAAKDQEAIQVVKTVFKTLSPDKLEILTTNLLAGNVDAKASFQRIINILYEKHNVVGDTSHQLDQLTNNQVAKGAVGLIENFKESYHRESGLGKAILIGAIFMAGKILFDKDIRAKESPFGMSYGDLFKLVGAGIGLNYLYGAVHPEKKTLMEQIGLSKMDQQVPENVRLMAKQAGIETPEQLAALTQINLFGAKEMKTWVDLYKQNKGAGYISPETYPFHYTDMDDASKRQRGRDLYVFIEHMMKEANGGEFVGMEDKFVGRYCSPEKNYTFTSIVMDIQSRAGTKMDFAGDTASESFKQKAAADLGPVLQDFGPDFGGFASSEYKVKLKSVPVTYIPSSVDDKGKVTEYNLKFPNGQIVKIASAGLSPSIKSHIDTLLVEDIKRRIQISPELQGKTPVWNGSKWEISNVTIGGVVNGSVFVEAMPNDDGFTMTFANMAISGHPSRTVTVLTGARTLNVMLQNDVYAYRVDGYEVGGKRPFAGLDIFVERTEDQTNDFVEIFGEIEGAKFRAKYNKGTNKFVEFTGNFRDEKFTNAKIEKVQSVNAEINQKFGDLAGLAEQANEQWARWDFWNSNLEGSINEAYWKYLCAFKVREAWT
ncbi:hypothetical protein KKG51_02435, partial [Patescibacteria group bacterium]|nr:hypothetical protein [Patescibacteria group bacterium]